MERKRQTWCTDQDLPPFQGCFLPPPKPPPPPPPIIHSVCYYGGLKARNYTHPCYMYVLSQYIGINYIGFPCTNGQCGNRQENI